MASSDLFELHHEAIERALSQVCRRHHLSRAEAEDFGSILRIHILEDDCAVLRKFGQRSTLVTYLHAVAEHRFQDWRDTLWGRWRPSAEARRLGEVAVLLERLVVRDRLPMDEAIEAVRINHGVSESRQALEAIAARLPVRHARVFLGEEVLASRPAADSGADASLIADAARRASAALEEVISELEANDRLILRMHFRDGRRLTDIARDQGIASKVLYRHLQDLLETLRAGLARRGITGDAAREIFARRGFELAESEIQREPGADVRPTRQRGSVSAVGGRW